MIMPMDHFENLVDQAKKLGAKTISIFGYGEPLLDKFIAERVRYCSTHGLKTFITTNGSLLSVDLGHELLKAGLSKIRFSVHGFFDSYEEVHRGLKFDDVSRKIGNFNAQNRIGHAKYKPMQCEVSISVIPMHGEEVERIKDFWPGKRYELEIWKPHNWVDGMQFRPLTKKRKKTCGRPHRGPVQINADGMMMVCCFDYDAKMTVGNTYKNTIEEILKGKSFEIIRTRHKYGVLDGLPCETCDQLNIGDNPLIYSSVDPENKEGRTSSTKFNLEE